MGYSIKDKSSKTCEQCGEIFFRKSYHSPKAWNETVKYCSAKCRAKSPKVRMKQSLSHKGITTWNKGIECPEETKRKLIECWARKRNSARWKKMSYRGLHNRIVALYGKANLCEECGKSSEDTRIHWASINHTYTKNREDWIQLCAKCHAEMDSKNRNLLNIKITL